MLTCKICGKKFRSEQALGGHISNAHSQSQGEQPQAQEEAAPQEAVAAEGAKATEALKAGATPEADVEGVMAAIRELFHQGYSAKQIKEQFGYARSTVDRIAPEFIKPDNPPEREGDGLPVVRKAGQGVEVLTPEAILRRYMDGDDDQKELRGMMKLRAAMLMVMDLLNMRKVDAEAFALEVKPILDLMKETREEQDKAAERARASSLESAREAAHEVLGQAMPYLDQRLKGVEEALQRKPDIASVQNPLQGVMARTMETMFNQLLRAFGFGGQQGQPSQVGQLEMPGFTYRKAKEGENV